MTITASTHRDVVVSLRGVSKSFGAQLALDGVDLEIKAGEIHAVVGQNGCGKSTLVKLLGGYHAPDPGSVASVGGEPYQLGSMTAADDAGLRFVHQDLGLIAGVGHGPGSEDELGALGPEQVTADGPGQRRVAARRMGLRL